MSDSGLASVLRRLHKLAQTAPEAEQADAVLLERFRRSRDQDAFAALVHRHGPLVWRVCRRVLHDSDAARDAFQATFLVLVRKADSIRAPEALAAWLHKTALRIACAAKDARARQSTEPVHDRPASAADPCHEAAWRELGAILEQEVQALPEKLRLPVLLCYWQGLTNEEAAVRLGCASGTLKARLTRARALLHKRLVRRGVTLPVGALALLLAPCEGEAALPGTMIDLALRALSGAEAGSVSTGVVTLAKLACHGGPLANAKAGVLVALALGLGVLGAGIWSRSIAGIDRAVEPDEAPKQLAAPATQPKTAEARTDRYGDPLPPGALLRLGTVRHRSLSPGSREQLLQDGKTLLRSTGGVVESQQEAVQWVDAATGRIADTWQVPEGLVVLGFAPNGRLALLSERASLQLWDLQARKPIREIFESKGRIFNADVSFAPDCKVVATAMYDDGLPIRVWDVTTGKQLWEIRGLSRSVMGFLPDGQAMVVRDDSDSDNRVSVHDRMTGRVLRSFATVPPGGHTSGLSPDGKAVLMGTDGDSVRVWDIATGEERAALGGHKKQAYKLAVRHDGKVLLTCDLDSVLVWDWPAGKLRQKIDLGSRRHAQMGSVLAPYEKLDFTPDGKRAQITAWGENAPRWFDLETGKELPRPAEAHNGPIWAIAIAPDGRLVSAGHDNTYRVWDLETGRQLHQQTVASGSRGAWETEDALASLERLRRPERAVQTRRGP